MTWFFWGKTGLEINIKIKKKGNLNIYWKMYHTTRQFRDKRGVEKNIQLKKKESECSFGNVLHESLARQFWEKKRCGKKILKF